MSNSKQSGKINITLLTDILIAVIIALLPPFFYKKKAGWKPNRLDIIQATLLAT